METDTNFLTFIQNHSTYFKKYDNLDTVEKSTICGWLYIFSAYCYDGNITKVLPEFTDKFGKTLNELIERLIQYNNEVNIKNIEAIQCSLPCQRERLVKAYLKNKTSIKPVVGNEYFINSRNLIKILMLIIVYISDEDIIKYETSYSKHNKNDTEYLILFERIDKYIDEIKKDDNFELKIEENINTVIPKNEEEKVIQICEFCNKQYNNLSSLNHHQKSAKFCLELQKKLDNIENKIEPAIYNCEHCEKTFTTKFALSKHDLSCNIKILKDALNKELKVKDEQYLKEKSELEKQILNLQYELEDKEIQICTQREDFLEHISKLENTIKEKDNLLVKIFEKLINNTIVNDLPEYISK
jgi:hypothetical protein